VTNGARLSIPIHHEGALLHVGDMHARQGDGEIVGEVESRPAAR
jgi:acetamidase/formamidase